MSSVTTTRPHCESAATPTGVLNEKYWTAEGTFCGGFEPREVQSDQGTADIIKAYLNYILTTGQDDAKGLLYAPLPEDLAKKAIAQIDDITVG